jgi:hypothetical protein
MGGNLVTFQVTAEHQLQTSLRWNTPRGADAQPYITNHHSGTHGWMSHPCVELPFQNSGSSEDDKWSRFYPALRAV